MDTKLYKQIEKQIEKCNATIAKTNDEISKLEAVVQENVDKKKKLETIKSKMDKIEAQQQLLKEEFDLSLNKVLVEDTEEEVVEESVDEVEAPIIEEPQEIGETTYQEEYKTYENNHQEQQHKPKFW